MLARGRGPVMLLHGEERTLLKSDVLALWTRADEVAGALRGLCGLAQKVLSPAGTAHALLKLQYKSREQAQTLAMLRGVSDLLRGLAKGSAPLLHSGAVLSLQAQAAPHSSPDMIRLLSRMYAQAANKEGLSSATFSAPLAVSALQPQLGGVGHSLRSFHSSTPGSADGVMTGSSSGSAPLNPLQQALQQAATTSYVTPDGRSRRGRRARSWTW
jgi:hypothetical protein